MSGEGPESVPTSADPRSRRPTKKRALTPVSAQAATVEALFARPDQTIRIPPPAGTVARRAVGAAPPEIVTNVQGSSAGAGSGEFHVYKASRRREYERLRRMDDEVRTERATDEFERTRAERARQDEEKTRRNREKREKMKARKAKAKAGGGGGGGGGNAATQQAQGQDAAAAKGPRPVIANNRNADDGEGDTEVRDAPPAAAEEPRGIVIEDD